MTGNCDCRQCGKSIHDPTHCSSSNQAEGKKKVEGEEKKF